jgi:hypothetical protein
MTFVSSAQAHFRTDRYDLFIDHLTPLINRDVTIKRYEIEVIAQDFSRPSPHLRTIEKVVNLVEEMTAPIPTNVDDFRDLVSREIRENSPEETAFAEELQYLIETLNNPSTAPAAFSDFRASIEREREDGGLRRLIQDCEEFFNRPYLLSLRATVEYGLREGAQRQATFSVVY